MDLLSLHAHMRGQTITVNGTTYPIDDKGVVRDVSEVDAAKMLQFKAGWQQHIERKPVTLQTEEKAPDLGYEEKKATEEAAAEEAAAHDDAPSEAPKKKKR